MKMYTVDINIENKLYIGLISSHLVIIKIFIFLLEALSLGIGNKR